MKLKMLHFQLIGASLLAIALSQSSSANSDLEFESNNNRRIVDSTDDVRAENRTKRLRQIVIEKASSTTNSDDDEDRKTLAQQVADGKYGLIQKELFASPVTRPGIISYEVNPEVPKDNVNNLGGLQPEEIWLAENHLLVLRGGVYTGKDQNGNAAWPPIDNYIAPQRQVKIPPNPKVPPPFPIQLKDGGPIEYVKGVNGTGGPIVPFFDPRFSPPGLFPFPPFPHPGENKSTPGNPGNSTEGNGFNPPFPFPPLPGIGLFPPAAAFLPPPGNLTELDEDDPSIYYPPPYDFIYHKDNSSFVPPGPLVPGIILPPPPNFFAAFENKTKTPTVKQQPTRKLTKPKPRPSQFAHDLGHKGTRPTKPPKKTFTVSIVPIITPSTTTTISPLVISTSDGSQNEIDPPVTLPPDTPVGEWVPIPAPRPFFISEINGLRSGSKMKFQSRNKTNFPSIPLLDNFVNGYDYTPPQKKGRQFPTPTPPSRGFKPIYVPPIVPTTIEPPSIFTTTYGAVENPENEYVYQGPQLHDYRIKNRPSSGYYDYNVKANEGVNPAPNTELYNDVSLTDPSYQQSHFDYFRQKLESSTTSSTPINFFYYDQNRDNLQSSNYQFSPTRHNSNKNLNPYRGAIQQPQSLVEQTTEKPPVFEYSYSAPGYGTVESPKVGTNFVTTQKPKSHNINFPSENEQQYSYFQYTDSRKPIYLYHETTPAYYDSRQSFEGQRERPKRPSSSQQQLGLDEITQKYFTMFGEKLNDQSPRQSTAAPPIADFYYNYEGERLTRPKAAKEQKVKFPQEEFVPAPVEQPYYVKPVQSFVPRPSSSSNRPNYPNQPQYPNYYGVSSPQSGVYADYGNEEGLVAPGHSLHADVNVNYKRPSPALEPDAELIDPAFVRPSNNAFISYQLPGSGGHFYFLTPQTLKNPYAPQQYPQVPEYYKRNTPPKSQRQVRSRQPVS